MRVPSTPPDPQAILSSRTREYVGALPDARYTRAVASIQAKYRHWDKVRFIAGEEGLDPELLWAMVKLARQSQAKQLPLQGAGGTSLTYALPDTVLEELMLIDQQLAGRLGSDDQRPFDAPTDERFVFSALREEAIASSMLEGAATTRRDAKRMLTERRPPKTHGERMVFNNYQAIQFIRQHTESRLTPEFLIEIQRIITKDTLEHPSQAGRLRNETETIQVVDPYGEVLHDPPRASELPARLERLCDFANQTGGPFLHPVLRACALHFQIAYDHPFCDGNGRTARAVFYWSMLRAGYWLFEYLPISRFIYKSASQYGRAFLYTETDDFDLTYFFVYKANVLRLVRHDLQQYLERKQTELVQTSTVFEKDGRLNHRQRSLILRFIRDPQQRVTIALHQGRHAIAYGTARSDLLNLEEWGYLLKHEQGNRFDFTAGPNLKDSRPSPPETHAPH